MNLFVALLQNKSNKQNIKELNYRIIILNFKLKHFSQDNVLALKNNFSNQPHFCCTK